MNGGGVAGSLAQQGAPAQAAPAASGSPNFFQRLLPTAGSILGGFGGAALGTIAAPFTFGAVNPITAGIAGAGAGDVLGRIGENATSHQNVKNDLGSSFVQGAAGQATGDILGLGLKGAGGLLSKWGGSAASKSADAEAAAAEQAATAGKATETQEGIDKQVTNTANYGVHSPTAQNVNKLGPNQKFMESMGFDPTDPFEMGKVANAGYTINDKVDQSLQNVNVDTKGLTNPVVDLIKSRQAQSPIATSLSKAINDGGVQLEPNGAFPQVVPATSLRQITQSIGREMGQKDVEIDAATRNSKDTTALKAAKTSLQQLRNDIVGKLNDNPDIKANIQNMNMSPEEKTILAGKSNEQLAEHIAGKVNAAQTYSDIVPEMQRFAQMGDLSKGAMDDITNVTAGPRADLRAKLTGSPNKAVTPQNVADKTAADHLLEAAANGATGNKSQMMANLLKAGTKARGAVGIPSGTIRNKVGSLLQGMSKFMPAASEVVTNAPNEAAPPVSTLGGIPAGGTISNTGVNSMQPGASQDPIQQLYNEILAQSQSPTGISDNLISTANTLAPMLQKQQMAAPIIQNALNTYANAGGAQGAAGGLLSRISGLFPGTAANTYNNASSAAAAQLSALLGISPEQAAAILPQLMQTQQTAAPQIAGIQSVLSTLPSTAGATP